MKFDTLIIGGGESALTAAITLAEAGQKVALATHGQTTLHFTSGSMDLLGANHDIGENTSPLAAAATLPAGHPYSIIGAGRLAGLADEVKPLFARAGIALIGEASHNHLRLTPVGLLRPAWLTLEGCPTADSPEDARGWGHVLLLGIEGMIDFFPEFIAANLKNYGIPSTIATMKLPASIASKPGTSEKMRATHIARSIDDATVDELARAVNAEIERHPGIDSVIMPAVAGLPDHSHAGRLRRGVNRRLMLLPTLPVSVPGLCVQASLERLLRRAGGTVLEGDRVVSGTFASDRLLRVRTRRLADDEVEADNYVLATGSFVSHGLESTADSVTEPIFGVDVNVAAGQGAPTAKDFFAAQPYMSCGVVTDGRFRCSLNGRTIANLRACGSILSGADSLHEGSGAGVAILTALAVAHDILDSKNSRK